MALREYPALPRLREQMALNASRQRQEREVVRMKERDRILKKVAEGDHADLAELKIAALLGRLQNDWSAKSTTSRPVRLLRHTHAARPCPVPVLACSGAVRFRQFLAQVAA